MGVFAGGMALSPEQSGIKRVRVRICGEELTLKGTGSEAYLELLASRVNTVMEKLKSLHPDLVRHRLAILSAIHLADELERAKRKNDELQEALEKAR